MNTEKQKNYSPATPIRYFSDLTIVLVGRIPTPQKERDHFPTCRVYSIELLAHGAMTFLHNGKKYQLKAPTVFWMKPGDVFGYKHPQRFQKFEHTWINMLGKRAERIYAALAEAFPEQPYLELVNADRIHALFLGALNDFLTAPAERHALIAAQVEEIIAHLCQQTGATQRQQSDDLIIRMIALLIHDYPERPWDIKQMATDNGMSCSNFRFRFRRTLGMPVYAYILEQRLLRTLNFLDGNHRIKEAALRCGFTDSTDFARAFRRRYGLSPREYVRRNIQKQQSAPSSETSLYPQALQSADSQSAGMPSERSPSGKS